jgi:pimeloyl-ACP methyl ester carboxylesterase
MFGQSLILSIWRDIWYLVGVVWKNINGRMDMSRPIIITGEHLVSTPVVLVHGSSGNQSEWLDALPLIQQTYKTHPIYAFSLDLPFHEQTGEQIGGKSRKTVAMKALASQNNWSIEEYADELAKRLMAIRVQKVILIGHSMGGLICAYFDKTHPNMVEHIVCISTPFHGAPLLQNRLVRWLGPKTRRHVQMTPGSNFLQALRQDLQVHKYVTIGSSNDIQVPDDYCHLDGGVMIKCSGWGHFSIVANPWIWKRCKYTSNVN